jgi:hypothetical protein
MNKIQLNVVSGSNFDICTYLEKVQDKLAQSYPFFIYAWGRDLT